MGIRILVVDDSSMMRKLISKVLKPPGHTIVGEAKNGIEALELYKSLRPDLVTMDITMDEMDGLSAAREIRNLDIEACPPVAPCTRTALSVLCLVDTPHLEACQSPEIGINDKNDIAALAAVSSVRTALWNEFLPPE